MTRAMIRNTSRGAGAALFVKGARKVAEMAYKHRGVLSSGSNARRITPSGLARNMKQARKKARKTTNYEAIEGATNPHSLQLSKFNHYNPSRLAEYIKISPPAYYSYMDSQVYLGTQGQQYLYLLPRNMAEYSQIETALNQTTSTNKLESQYFLEYIDQKTMITNFSTAVNEITIWELLVKDNLGNGFDPVQCIQAGYNAKFNVSGATAPLVIAGDPFLRLFANPLESTVFRQYYTVEKCIKVTLKPGECHKHHKYIQYNKTWKNTMGSAGAIGGGGSNPVYIKGWTRLTMIQANGVCATDGAGSASVTKIEHAVVQSTNIRYRTPQGKATNTLQGKIDGSLLSPAIALVGVVAEAGNRPAIL